jgi:uncharacterized protein DUF6335
MKTKRHRITRRTGRVPDPGRGGHVLALLDEVTSHPETGRILAGGDPDADWQRAYSSGEEAVGGSVATPDQDVVDEIGRALGVEQGTDAPVTTSGDILRRRDRFRWHLERDAADADEGRARRRATR